MEDFFISCDGIRLHARLRRPGGAGKGPLCILIHGFTGHMDEEHVVAAGEAMIEAGISVLWVEMYGHGKSDGEFRDHTLYKWVTNALSAVQYVKDNYDFVTDLYISGHSQGGLLVMLIAGMCADDFKALIPLSPAWMIPGELRKGSILDNAFDAKHIPDSVASDEWELSGDYIRVAQTIHVEDEIERYEGPVYIIHGVEDEVVPFFYAEKAGELYKNAKVIPIQGADHCFFGHLEDMKKAIRSVFA